jgi:hypothetical protein
MPSFLSFSLAITFIFYFLFNYALSSTQVTWFQMGRLLILMYGIEEASKWV